MSPEQEQKHVWSSDTALLIAFALVTVLSSLDYRPSVRISARRTWQRWKMRRHLDWGFVAYPPITPLFGRLSLILFGTSLAGFRFFAAMAQAVAVVLTGLMARELGGRRWRATPRGIRGASVLHRRRRADAIRVVRLSVLGVGGVLRGQACGRVTIRAGGWRLARRSVWALQSKYTMGFFAIGHCRCGCAYRCRKIPAKQVAVVRSGPVYPDFSTEFDLASEKPFHFA